VPATCVAMKLERAGDVLTMLGRFPEAVAKYMEARAEWAALAMRPEARPPVRVEQKLRKALNGERNAVEFGGS
jgi:hypothetical protein